MKITDFMTEAVTVAGGHFDLIIDTDGAVVPQSGTNGAAIGDAGNDDSFIIRGMVWNYAGDPQDAVGIYASGANFDLNVVKGGILRGPSGAELLGANASVINRGLISGDTATGLEFLGADGVLQNYGRVFGADFAVSSQEDITATNFGDIISAQTGIGFRDNLTGNSLNITNHGLIEARVAIGAGFGSDTIVNDGKIIGDIDLAGGQDVIDMRGGSIKGAINSGSGDDTLITDSAKIGLTEGSGGGLDTVKSSVSYTLSDYVDVLRLTGSANIDGTATAVNDGRVYLDGNSGKNVLTGLGADDVLDGGAGNDVLIGGAGLDLFLFSKGDGVDTIKDFHHNQNDEIVIDGVTKYSQIENKLEKHGNDTWIDLGHGDIIVVHGVTPRHLDHTDFGL